MKIRKLAYTGGGESGTVNIEGRVFETPIYAARHPLASDEVSTKSYVDSNLTALPAASFVSGVLNKNRTPSFYWSTL